jgi:hypothetical protein
VAVSDDGLLCAIECKGPKGQLRPGQAEWILRFGAVPGCVFAGVVGPKSSTARVGYDAALEMIQRNVQVRRMIQEATR